MKKKFKLMFTFMVMLCLAICLGVNASAAEIVDSGNCGANGDDVTWVLYDDGNLVISGMGEMADYEGNTFPDYFDYRLDIKSVVIEDGITNIGDYMFNYCALMTSVTIPDSVTDIGNGAFKDCNNLAEITIPETVTSIGDGAFAHCYGLTDVTIPDNVASMGSDVFTHCEKLANIEIGNGIETIGDRSFYACTSLERVTIPASVTSIGKQAFVCQSLKDVYYAGTEEDWNNITIGDYNINLTEDIIHYNFVPCASHIEDNADGYCDICGVAYVYVVDSGACGANVNYTLYSDGKLVISGEGDMYDYNFASSPLHDNDAIKNVVIEYGVTSIGDNAFTNCEKMADITIADSVTSIGKAAFLSCSYLAEITIPGSVKEIGIDAFNLCTGLESVTIENGVTTIGDMAFMQCFTAKNVSIPASVTNIGMGAFAWTMSLESITVDENNEYYLSDNGILFNKDKTELIAYTCGSEVTTYTIPDAVTSIADCAFAGSLNLVEVVIPDSVTNIGIGAFASCENLASVTIGSGVTTIGDSAFEDSKKLANVYYNGTKSDWNKISAEDPCLDYATIHYLKHIDSDKDGLCDDCNEIFVVDSGACGANVNYTLYSDGKLVISGEGDIEGTYSGIVDSKIKPNVKNVVIENGITGIGYQAFYDCNNLESVIIPDGVTNIGYGAFAFCENLTSVVIPGSVETIGTNAFVYCRKLESVMLENGVATIAEAVFMDCHSLKYISIPESVTSIGLATLKNCASLENIDVDEKNEYFTVVDGVLFNKDKTELIAYNRASEATSYTIPDGVTSIALSAFSASLNLTEVIIPDSVTTIEYGVFELCENLETVTIGSGVKYIGEDMFYECYNIKVVYFNGTEEDWNKIELEEETMFDDIEVHFLVVPHVHTPGEWEVVTEATYDAEGKKVQKCAECGEVLAEEVMPKLVRVTVADDKTGVAIEFDSDEYDGDVEVSVEETFDGKAFELIDTTVGESKATIFDISMSVDGVTVQPNGKLTVKIPLPEGYNPNQCFIYYLNTDNNTIEKLATSYADGYLTFETDHFSYYAVVEVAEADNDDTDADKCSCDCHKTNFFAKLIWKIKIFFNKLFKTNKECACGIYHY